MSRKEESMYKVKFILQIHSCHSAASSEDIYVYKQFDLPFPPSKDISIEHETKKGEIDCIESIEEIVWNADSQTFVCYVPSDKEIYEADLHNRPYRPIREIVNEYLEADWLIEDKYLKKLNNSDS